MKKVCFISHLHLSLNPRLRKEAIALSKAGFDVTILSVFVSSEKLKNDLQSIEGTSIQYEGVVDLRNGTSLPIEVLLIKSVKRLASYARRIFGYETSWLLGGAMAKRFTKRALQVNADLYIAHLEFGFFIGRELISRSKKVAFDFEDWYSRDYLVKDRPVKLLQTLEQFAIRNGLYCTCPSASMADAIQDAYQTKAAIHVIYNGFSRAETVVPSSDLSNRKKNAIIWFSQTIGPGRGLELLFQAVNFLSEPVDIHLLGAIDKKYKEELIANFPFPKGHKLQFHLPVTHDALFKFLQQFSIGLALEEKTPASRDKTITNKVLQYLQAGLKVVATKTDGQVELSRHFLSGIELIPSDHPEDWSKVISKCVAEAHQDVEGQVSIFNQSFSWEAQEELFFNLVNKAINK